MKRVLPLLMAVVLLLVAMPVCAADVTINYGDVNRDGRINNRDLGMLQQHINEYLCDIDQMAADITGDGRINNRDLGMLQLYLNEYEIQFPIQLPAAGYDIDKCGRIFVTSLKQNGSTVTITIANQSDKWITEETCYVQYICTDADGNVLNLDDKYYGVVYFGMLEVGESVTKTITLPMGTDKLEFGAYRIVYWSQWQK